MSGNSEENNEGNGLAAIAFVFAVVAVLACIVLFVLVVGMKGAVWIWQLTKSVILTAGWLIWHFGIWISFLVWGIDHVFLGPEETLAEWDLRVLANQHFFEIDPFIAYFCSLPAFIALTLFIANRHPEKITLQIKSMSDEIETGAESPEQERSIAASVVKAVVGIGAGYLGARAGYNLGRKLLR